MANQVSFNACVREAAIQYAAYDEENSGNEDRYDTIGDLSAGTYYLSKNTDSTIGSVTKDNVLFVVYTERIKNDSRSNNR